MRKVLIIITAIITLVYPEIVLTPAKVVELALQNNRQNKASAWAVKEKEEARKEVKAGFGPKVTGSASYRRMSDVPSFGGSSGGTAFDAAQFGTELAQTDPHTQAALGQLMNILSGFSSATTMGNKDNFSLGVQVQQPIFTGFKLINAYRLAGLSEESQKLDAQKNEQVVSYTALTLYWSLYTLEKSVQLARDAEAQLLKLRQDQEKMFEQKMIAEQDLLQIKASYATAHVSVLQAEQGYSNIHRSLLDFLDLDPMEKIVLSPGSEAVEAGRTAEDLKTYIEWVRNNRPDVQNMKKLSEIMGLSEKISKSGYWPTIALVGDYTYAKPNQSVSFEDKWAGSWYVMAMLNWNIFDFGAEFRKGKQAEFRRKAVEEQLKMVERNVVTEAINAWETVDASKKEYEASKEAMVASDLTFKATKLKYDQGMVSTFEFLSARSNLTQAQFVETSAKMKLIMAIENMKIGGLVGTSGGK